MSKVEKKEGATMTCKCGTVLTCHSKTYDAYTGDDGVDHPAKTVLQWQNSDLTPHYKWAGPGKFNCNIPQEAQQVQGPTSADGTITLTGVEANAPSQLDEKLDKILDSIKTLTDITQSILHIVADKKLQEDYPEPEVTVTDD